MSDLVVAVTVADSAGLKTSASSTITVIGAQSTINAGLTTIGNINDTQNGNVIIAQALTLPQPGALQSLSVYVRTVGGQLRLGLYSGNVPTMLIVQTAAFTPVAGWNTQPAVSSQLLAGQYWLASFSQLNALVLTKNSGGSAYYKGLTFGPMPAAFPSAPSAESALWSLYGTFAIDPPPPPPPNTPIGIGLSSVSVGKPPNANSVVGAVKVTTADGGPYTGKLVLGGADAAKFVLTNAGLLPCNLVVGPTSIPAGNYSINLTAS